ncbi:chemotaxis protein CheX [Halobacillus litoralis]|uniref:Chemotaxis protein CheX n=1 Tax=Halobacillus litoralis TaxID=45668 RepID=A0A410M788_9BACI|nr:chemotaxis protein CheX [Halobacillus litoralis]QAS50828.1 chemotaxis protein CheX [Halobacillus litoralis]
MSLCESITAVLNGSVDSVHSIMPFELTIEKPSILHEPQNNSELAVLIGMTGDVTGKLMIEGSNSSFGYVGEKMYGMPLEGEMLFSFTGELANMIAGHLATSVSEQSLSLDITPPTVIEGNAEIHGFKRGFQVPVNLQENHTLHLVLMIEEKQMKA